MSDEHFWTDPPHSFCEVCGMPNLLEIAIRRFDYDVFLDRWRDREIKKQYETLFLPCPINKEQYEALIDFAYGYIDETQVEIL